MPELRAALVMVPPLLTDLMTATLIPRLAASGLRLQVFTVAGGCGTFRDKFRFYRGRFGDSGPGRCRPRHRRHPVFAGRRRCWPFPADLNRLLGPAAGESAPFTPEILAERLRDLAKI